MFSGSAQNVSKAEIIHTDITGLLWQKYVLLFFMLSFFFFLLYLPPLKNIYIALWLVK